MDIYKTLHVLITAHELRVVQFLLGSVNNEGHITRRTKYLLRCITPCNIGICLQLYTYFSLRMRYKYNKFGFDRSIMKGTLLEQITFSDVSRLVI
jgi:hypothetical protein